MVGAFLATGALAEEAGKVTGTISVALYNEYLCQSESEPKDLNLVYVEIYPEIDFYVGDNVFVHTYGAVELVQQPNTGFFHAFKGQGAYLGELTLNYEDDDVSFFIGKFDPNIISGFTRTPDLYITTTDQNELEITERMDFGGFLPLKSANYGTHRIYGSVFRQDTTVLSESWINNHGRNLLSDGGPSNTGSLDSVYLGSYGGGVAGFEDLVYHVAIARQAVDIALGSSTADADDEYWVTGSLQQEFKIDDDLSVTPC